MARIVQEYNIWTGLCGKDGADDGKEEENVESLRDPNINEGDKDHIEESESKFNLFDPWFT